MARMLGYLEAGVLSYAQMRGIDTVTTGEIANVLCISFKQSTELLSRLHRKKTIARVSRGLFLVPKFLPADGIWTPSAFKAIDTLMSHVNATYQITGLAAFQRYGWDGQMPNLMDVYNNRISGTRTVGASQFRLIKVDDSRLGDTITVSPSTDESAVYSSRKRALLDAVYDWKRFYGIPRAYNWIRYEIKHDRSFLPEFVKTVISYGNIGTIRRIGKLLESEGVSKKHLAVLLKPISNSTSPIPWNPYKPKRGSADLLWGVVMND